MHSQITTDVLICGGGPCGLMLANELGRRGISCLLVDKKPATAFNPQANATQARTMEHFRRLGFADKVRAKGLPPDHPTDIAYLTRFAGHELARLRLPTAKAAGELVRTLTGSWSAAELPHRVSQKFVEVILREEAQALPSVELRYGWEMLSFSDDGVGVTARIAPIGGGEPVSVSARYLMAADGARSPVRYQLGIGWEGATGTKRKFMGGKMFAIYLKAPDFYRLNPNDRAWMYVVVNAEVRGFFISVDGVSEFVLHVQLPDGDDVEGLTEADARRLFALASGLDIPAEILSIGTWLAGHALVASELQRGRVFWVGTLHTCLPPQVAWATTLQWKMRSIWPGSWQPS
jgi:2-polyprenyl-6-methoxyphenol hydroxylase-like FAD-dependent oxidoreductase